MFKRAISFLSSLAIVWSLGALPVFAINATVGLDDAAGSEGAGYDLTASLPSLIGSLINAFLGLLGVIFLLLTIYAGFLWMTSQGDDKKVASAKNILVSAVVGLVIILAAYTITSFVTTAAIFSTTSSTGGTDESAGSPWF